MKHIVKQGEPQSFSDWKAQSNDDWQPTYEDLRGSIKADVKVALTKEQGYICCYCERRLTDLDSHIEHFQPQNNQDVDPLDYKNMLCSCQRQMEKGEPRRCGNLKGNWFNKELLVSPFELKCEARFAFTGDGLIKPALDSDQGALETIMKLGLAVPKLNALRRGAVEPFLDDQISNDDINTFVAGYLEKDADGRFGEFWTTIRYIFGASS